MSTTAAPATRIAAAAALVLAERDAMIASATRQATSVRSAVIVREAVKASAAATIARLATEPDLVDAILATV